MRKMTRLISMLLLLALILSAVPYAGAKEDVTEEQALPEERAETKAVSVSSISVPAYSGGTSSGWMTYDCGQYLGLANTGTESKMRIVTGTTATQFLAYGTSLKDLGYTVLYEKKIPAQSEYNRHYKFLAPDGSHVIYTYFVDAYKETRIIVDTNVDSFRRYSYTGSGDARTEIYMVPFSAAHDGYYYNSAYGSQNRNNAGAMYVIKFSDNSLFVIDGGSYIQMSDRDCERVYALLRKITGIPEGEKITINTWFVTHYHDDHVSGFPRFLSKYYTQFDLLNVMYNFDVVGASGDNMEIIGKLYPNAKYYKQHTGEYFTICDVRFDVLYTVEDLYTPNSSNQLVLSNTACMRKSGEENNCSSVLRVTMGGKELLLTGDIYDADRILLAMYPEADLKSDVLQIPHHAFDGHVTLVKAVAPTISFLNQVESATNNRKDLYTNNHNWMPYAGTIYYGNSNLVGYCAEEGVFLQEPFTDPVDWLSWGNLTVEMEEANPYTSGTVTDSEKYYRYDRVTTAPTKFSGTYMIVDDKLGYPLSYNSSNGTVDNGSMAFYTNDTYYFGASLRRNVNWSISSGTAADLSLVLADGGKGYYVSTAITKGSGDYWGTNSKNANMALGRGDTFTASGMFSSWASFTNQMESTTNSIRMDMLQDNTFLIYARYNTNGSTYHPLYRDAYMATTDKGWGAPSLTKTAANEKLDYLKLRLYSYNTTPDTLLLSWTGHKDYYANPGISKSQALSLLTADLRVNYTFKTSGHSGEIFYDGWQQNAIGTYWLEFPSGFGASSGAGNYTVTIKFKNHAGTTLTLGSFTLHLRDRSSEPATKQLFFDFTDNTTARQNYQTETQYNGTNFDAASRWEFIEYNASTKSNDITTGTVDTKAGTLTLYTKTADTARKNLSIRAFAGSFNPLNYSPKNAEVVQIRFKAENLKSAADGAANFRLCYYKDGGTDLVYETIYSLGADYVSNGEYVVIQVPLTQTFRNCTAITGIRPAFSYVIPNDLSKPGSITIDYLYIGPAANAPKEETYTVVFANEDGTVLQQSSVVGGDAVAYTGATPAKAYDADKHYTFVGWVDSKGNAANLSKITADATFYASYTATAHSFTKETVMAAGCESKGLCRFICACGYSYTEEIAATGHTVVTDKAVAATCTTEGKTEGSHCSVCNAVIQAQTVVPATGHSYTSKITTAATCTNGGVKTYTCSKCSHSYTEAVEATGHTPVIDAAVPATCTNSGLTEGSHCSVCGVVIVAQQATSRLGHDYHYADNDNGTHTGACSRCDKTITAEHEFAEGVCICGAKEITVDETIRILHTLDLASDISVTFAVPMTDLAGYDSYYMECVLPEYDGNDLPTTSTVRIEPVVKGGYYYFTLTGITAVRMGDLAEATLHLTKNGMEYRSRTDSYSVATYAYAMLNSSKDQAMLTLCADLLRYGAEAQKYKGYRTDALVDAEMTETHRSYLSNADALTFTSTEGYLGDVKNPVLPWVGKTLDLGSKVGMKFVFNTKNYSGDLSKLTMKVSYKGSTGETKTVTLTGAEAYGTTGSYYSFTFYGLLAAELRTVVEVAVFEGETQLTETLRYSAETYAYKSATGELAPLCKALFAYSDSAKAYFAK